MKQRSVMDFRFFVIEKYLGKVRHINERSQSSILVVMVTYRLFLKFVWELIENENIQGFHIRRKYFLSKNNQGPHR